jgi:hypothetical protein
MARQAMTALTGGAGDVLTGGAGNDPLMAVQG